MEGEVTAAAKSILCILSPLLLAENDQIDRNQFWVGTENRYIEWHLLNYANAKYDVVPVNEEFFAISCVTIKNFKYSSQYG